MIRHSSLFFLIPLMLSKCSRMIFLRSCLYFCVFLLGAAFTIYTQDGNRLPVPFERIGPFGGNVRSLLMDSKIPHVVYLGTSHGKIYKSLDGGKSWNILHPGIGQNAYVVDTLVQHPSDSNHLYAGAWDLHSDGGGLFESKDAGSTWVQIPLPQISPAVRDLALCSNDATRMIVGTLAGAYVSADSGQTWEQVGGDLLQKAESVAIDPKDPRFLYVGTWRLGYRSSDFGKTWTRVSKGMPLDSDIFSISLDNQNPEIIYASACSGVYRSTNRASSWTRLRLLSGRLSIRAHVTYIDPSDSRRIYSGTTEGLFVSQNEGKTWERITSAGITVNAVQIDLRDNQCILLGTESQGVLRSEDGGRTWNESNLGFVSRQISQIIPDSSTSGKFFAGQLSGDGGFFLYDDSSNKWSKPASGITPGTQVLSLLSLPEKQGQLVGTSQGVFVRPYGKDSWDKLSGSIGKRIVYDLVFDQANSVLYAGTDEGIYRTSIAAMNFRPPPNYRFSPKVWSITLSPTTPGLIYAGTTLGILRSWDQGTTWNVISTYGLPPRVPIKCIAIMPSNAEHLLAGTSAGLYISKNGGIHWQRAADGRLAVDTSSIIFLDPSGSKILAADNTGGGVFLSEDEGLNWEKISLAGHGEPIHYLFQDLERQSRIYISTRSDGVYRLSLPESLFLQAFTK